MMITKKIIDEEIVELKSLLINGDAEVPSFWVCMWPGLVLTIWNIICALTSTDKDYVSGNDSFMAVAFSLFISVIILLGISSGRALLLSVPISFRTKSILFIFLARKMKVYACVYMLLVLIASVYNRFFYTTSFPFLFLLIVLTIGMGIIINIDLSRYQLHAFTSVLNSFKERGQKV